METTNATRPTVKLQGVGLVFSRPAYEIAAGDVVMFNGGTKQTVLAVAEVSAKYLEITYAVATSVFYPNGTATQKVLKTKQMASATPKA